MGQHTRERKREAEYLLNPSVSSQLPSDVVESVLLYSVIQDQPFLAMPFSSPSTPSPTHFQTRTQTPSCLYPCSTALHHAPYRPCRRSQPSRGKGGKNLEGHAQSRPEGSSQIQTDNHYQTRPYQLHAANQTKHSKTQNLHLQMTRLGAPQPRALHVLSKPRPDTYEPRASRRDEEEEDKSDMVIPNFLQIPVRHKIPTQPIPKRDATSK